MTPRLRMNPHESIRDELDSIHEHGLMRQLRTLTHSGAHALWEGRALQAGHVSKSTQSVALTSAVIKKQLGLDPSADEARYELALKGGKK